MRFRQAQVVTVARCGRERMSLRSAQTLRHYLSGMTNVVTPVWSMVHLPRYSRGAAGNNCIEVSVVIAVVGDRCFGDTSCGRDGDAERWPTKDSHGSRGINVPPLSRIDGNCVDAFGEGKSLSAKANHMSDSPCSISGTDNR